MKKHSSYYSLLAAAGIVIFGATTTQAATIQPTTLAELEDATSELAISCRQATIGISHGREQGTGVIFSPKGLILTACHCVGYVGREFDVVLSDGRKVKAISVYVDSRSDLAMATILDKAPDEGWPHRPIKLDGDLKNGDWCMAFGHGGGMQTNRPVPMRVGRVLGSRKWLGATQLITDNTVTWGDSGGPLFDIEGNIAGINITMLPEHVYANHHGRISKIIELWGETLRGEKDLPDLATLKKKREGNTGKAANPNKLTDIQRAQTTALLKQQFGADFPQAVINIILDSCSLNPDSGKVEIKINRSTIKKIRAAGFDPVKIGLITKAQNEQLGPQPQPKPPIKMKGEPTTQQDVIEKALRAQFGGKEISDEAMEILLAAAEIDGKTKQLALTLTPETIAKLKAVGLDIAPKAPPEKIHTDREKAAIIASLKHKYGNDLSPEALAIFLSVASINRETGNLKIDLTTTEHEKLKELGIELGNHNKEEINYDQLAAKFGDSSDEFRKTFPEVDAAIPVFVAGKQVCLATPVKAEGYLVAKSSEIPENKKIGLEIDGEKLLAKLIARDDSSDLALLKVEEKITVPEWAEETPGLGHILLSSRSDRTMLGIVGNLPREIPEKRSYVNRSKKIKTEPDTNGNLSKRSLGFPECLTHDANIWANDCGGPLYDRHGKVVGVNIARYDRTAAYSLTRESLDAALERLFSAK